MKGHWWGKKKPLFQYQTHNRSPYLPQLPAPETNAPYGYDKRLYIPQRMPRMGRGAKISVEQVPGCDVDKFVGSVGLRDHHN